MSLIDQLPPFSSRSKLLSLQGLSIRTQPRLVIGNDLFGGRAILEDINLEVTSESFVAVVGESGAGKSLLGRAVLGLLPPGRWSVTGTVWFKDKTLFSSNGAVTVYDNLVYARREDISAIFQEPGSYLNPTMRIWRQMAERMPPEERVNRSLFSELSDKLRTVRLAPDTEDGLQIALEYLRRFPHEFSHGQLQRIMASMALGAFDLLIADEPTASLDTRIQREVVDLMLRLRSTGQLRSVLLITHDLRLVKALLSGPQDVVYFLGRDEDCAGPYRIVCRLPARDLFGSERISSPHLVRRHMDVAGSYSPDRLSTGGTAIRCPACEPILEIRNLTQSYPRGWFRGVKAVLHVEALTVNAGEMLGVVGESGCGKSTLVRSVARLVKHTDKNSEIRYRNRHDRWLNLLEIQPDGMAHDSAPMRVLRREIQVIFQDSSTAFNPELTIGEMIDETVEMLGYSGGVGREARLAEFFQLCLAVDLAVEPSAVHRLMIHYPDELSAGQRQRFALARALFLRPALLIADEPFTNVDRVTVCDMVRLLARHQRDRKMTVILVSHDLRLVMDTCDSIVVMATGDDDGVGRIVARGTALDIASSQNAIVRNLVDSILPF